MTTHEWRENDASGAMIYYRANHHAGRWTFLSRPKSEPEWTRFDSPPREVLIAFREVLRNKIQRRRAPEKLILQIDDLIKLARPVPIEEEE